MASLSVDRPLLSVSMKLNTAETGSLNVTLQGSGVWLWSATGTLATWRSSCEATSWESDLSVRPWQAEVEGYSAFDCNSGSV